MAFSMLTSLPTELITDILDRLHTRDLAQLSLTSRWSNTVAVPFIWREVELKDRTTDHGSHDGIDQHDDTPLIRKLYILTHNPLIAKSVQVVTHRCHLPPPNIFAELPDSPFTGQTLSCDPRTIKLIQLAVPHMGNVHTLRIINGHLHVNDALVRCFFDSTRIKSTPVRRLWLENCHISAAHYLSAIENRLNLPSDLLFQELESIRFRRLHMHSGRLMDVLLTSPDLFVHARGSSMADLQDGVGGFYPASVNGPLQEICATLPGDEKPRGSGGFILATLKEAAHCWDDQTYLELWNTVPLPPSLHLYNTESRKDRITRMRRFDLLESGDNLRSIPYTLCPTPAEIGVSMLNSSCQTLTSICLDWILTMPGHTPPQPDKKGYTAWLKMYLDFFSLRFPRLKALQFRNNCDEDTRQPEGLYLLDQSEVKMPTPPPRSGWEVTPDVRGLNTAPIDFMEAHTSLQCLAWPMDTFFSERKWSPVLAARIGTIVNNLGRTLVDLRVDAMFRPHGDPMTENGGFFDNSVRYRRRRFIEEFVSKMRKVESIKIEGGVPRDERRETIRALHACRITKIVMIGVTCPLGNTWGAKGKDIGLVAPRMANMQHLEGEDKDATFSLGPKDPTELAPDFRFEASYGWSAAPPMLHTIASLHRNTVKELKFCGFQGAPVLFTPTSITSPLLASLKHFDNLESLILSTYLSTNFEGRTHDDEIIKYWLDSRSSTSTSLVRVFRDEDVSGEWEKRLLTEFAPKALAWEATRFIGPFLSKKAKARKEGVRVRVSICIGRSAGIFDLDLRVAKGSCNSDVCLGFEGPREELEQGRQRSKLENRRWF